MKISGNIKSSDKHSSLHFKGANFFMVNGFNGSLTELVGCDQGFFLLGTFCLSFCLSVILFSFYLSFYLSFFITTFISQ